MGRVIYNTMVSFDGYIAGPGEDISWHRVDEEVSRYVIERERGTGAFLLGRKTYQAMYPFWDTYTPGPDESESMVETTRMMQETPKVVFSRTLTEVGPNARVVSGELAAEIESLRTSVEGNLSVGGGVLAAALRDSGLIEEYGVLVNPVILGGGTPMLAPTNRHDDLELVETRAFDSGVVLLRYRRPE